MKPKLQRSCACGCLRTFSTTRVEDLFASRACAELYEQRRPRKKREWIDAATLALRLQSFSSIISRLAADGIIPYDLREDGVRIFHLPSVVRAAEDFNARNKKRKKILTKYFSTR